MAGAKKITQEMREAATNFALEGMSTGFNCAESTLRGLIKAGVVDMPLELGNRLVCGYGGGGGRAGNSCGALCAGLMALNWEFGRENPLAIDDIDERRAQLGGFVYVYSNNFTKRFVESNGVALCKEVIERNGHYLSDAQMADCQKIVKSAVEHVCDMVELTEDEIRNLPMGYTIESIGS